ncbi:TM2 domain-containing protein [Periweissella cryptocerci]|uniref:TM2 domain-containing protein n=2 Tax=Periweissella cryptocerci TaxID=2506420 RepID=A0A4P6YX96_9LACO|nr:TM2 domain-containing protein [Periweissella cryptocerci]
MFQKPDGQIISKKEDVHAGVQSTSQAVAGVIQPTGQVGAKSKIAAGLLGIFLGSLGIHNFYLGQTQAGVIKLVLSIVLCWTIVVPSVVSIWGLVEGVMILASKPGTKWHLDAAGNELQD